MPTAGGETVELPLGSEIGPGVQLVLVEEDGTHDVAPVTVHDTVAGITPPGKMLVGLTTSATVGGGSGVTVSIALAVCVPPTPVHFSVYVYLPAEVEVTLEDPIGSVTVGFQLVFVAEGVHAVAPVTVQDSVAAVVPSAGMLAGITPNVMEGGALTVRVAIPVPVPPVPVHVNV